MDSDTRGRRGRARCSRESSRSAGGLRIFSSKVCEKIQSRGITTMRAVADELVADQNMSAGNAKDAKSIRRRCYDAINVLLACGLIKKPDKKRITWRGHSSVENDRLRAKKAQVEQKKLLLQDLERKHKTMEALLALGTKRDMEAQQSSGGDSSACTRRFTLPFMLVQGPGGAALRIQRSEDQTEVEFESTEAKLELHTDWSVVMQLQQREAERQANQQHCKDGRAGPAQAKAATSGQPTPAPETAATARPSACDVSTPETREHQPSMEPAPVASPPQQQQQQQEVLSQPSQSLDLPQQQQQQVQHMQQEQQKQQLVLPPPLQQQQRVQQVQQHHLLQQQSEQGFGPLPSHHLASAPPSGNPLQERAAPPQPAGQQVPDFLSHLKPVATNRSTAWSRPHVHGAVPQPVAPQQVQAQSGAPVPPQQQPSVQSLQPAASHPLPSLHPQPQGLSLPQHLPAQPQVQVGFPHVGGFSHFFRPFSAQKCFQQDSTYSLLGGGGGGSGGGGPLPTQPSLVAPGAHAPQLLHDPALHYQPPPALPQPSQPQAQAQAQPLHEQQFHPALGGMLDPSPPSLYAFEQMDEEPLPASLLPFASEDPDPLGFGVHAACQVYDQLAYMGWPYSMSPDPFSPSAFLVTPSFMKGQCRSEQTLPVGAVKVGVPL